MTIIDHLSVRVADVPVAHVFYGRVLDMFAIRCLAEGNKSAAFGRDHIAFL